jgi:hypothetical protein
MVWPRSVAAGRGAVTPRGGERSYGRGPIEDSPPVVGRAGSPERTAVRVLLLPRALAQAMGVDGQPRGASTMVVDPATFGRLP